MAVFASRLRSLPVPSAAVISLRRQVFYQLYFSAVSFFFPQLQSFSALLFPRLQCFSKLLLLLVQRRFGLLSSSGHQSVSIFMPRLLSPAKILWFVSVFASQNLFFFAEAFSSSFKKIRFGLFSDLLVCFSLLSFLPFVFRPWSRPCISTQLLGVFLPIALQFVHKVLVSSCHIRSPVVHLNPGFALDSSASLCMRL